MFDIHLMIHDPIRYIDDFAQAGGKMDSLKSHCFETRKAAVFDEIALALREVSEESAASFCTYLSPGRRVFCDASGRSRLQIAGFAMRLAQMGYDANLVGEVTATAIRPEDTFVVCSASGSTPGIVAHVNAARQYGCRVLLVTAAEQSVLAQMCDEMILLKAGSKNTAGGDSIQPMGTLFEQSAGLLFDLLVLELMNRYGITQEKMRKNHSNLE